MAQLSNVDSLQLGSLLQIVFTNGVRNQISESARDFEYIDRFRVSDSMAREIKFMFQHSFGPAAVQYGNPGVRGNFPRRQSSGIQEYTAKLKKVNITVDVDYDVFDRARKTPEKYMLPLALELQSKATAGKRRIAADFHADGTGVLGEIESVEAYDTSADTQVIKIKKNWDAYGHVGLFEFGDLLIATQKAGTARAVSTSTNFYAYKVVDKDREASTITIQPVTSTEAVDSDVSATNLAPTDVFYRAGDPILNGVNLSDNSSVTSSNDLTSALSDYGFGGSAITGLDSLLRSGRTVHGISLSGANKPTEKILQNNEQIDSRHIQQLLSNVKTAVGEDAYKWKIMTMSPEAHDSLIDSRESDRRFQTVDDNKRGVKYFAYVHGNDVLETNATEFCKPAALYLLPEATDGKKVFEFWSTDFETVKGDGMNDFHLAVNSSGYENGMVSFMQMYGQIICNHAAACGALRGFTTI